MPRALACAVHATTPKTRKDKIGSDHVIKLFEIMINCRLEIVLKTLCMGLARCIAYPTKMLCNKDIECKLMF